MATLSKAEKCCRRQVLCADCPRVVSVNRGVEAPIEGRRPQPKRSMSVGLLQRGGHDRAR